MSRWLPGNTLFLLILFSVLSILGPASADPTLVFFDPGEDGLQSLRSEYKLSHLRKNIPAQRITYDDPHFKKPKTFEAFSLKDVLRFAFGRAWQKSVYSDVEFISIEDHTAVAKTYVLRGDGSFIAFRDADKSDWELFPTDNGKKDPINPGPFYLFWKDIDPKLSDDYLWFWRIKAIHLVRYEDRYPKTIPLGVTETSAAFQGFKIYRGKCFSCHSLHQQGGRLGPDLAAPLSILKYRRDLDLLKEFIRHPSKFRFSNMPDFLDLSDKDLNHLIIYFEHIDKQHNSPESDKSKITTNP